MLEEMTDPVKLLRRIAVTVLGTAILAVGVVLLVAPGPGILVIALALAVFAIEYEWARRRLAEVQALARSAAEKTASNLVARATALVFGAAALGLGGVLVFTDLLPFSGLLTGISVAVAGLLVIATTVYSVRELHTAARTQSASQSRESPDQAGSPPRAAQLHRPSPPVPSTVAARSRSQHVKRKRVGTQPRLQTNRAPGTR
jgi:hypothetical protein